MVTKTSLFLAPPRISFEGWMRVWDSVGFATPLWNTTPTPRMAVADMYGEIMHAGHDPAVWLAICGREHNWGRNPDSVLRRNDTRSWTNARTVRLPGLSHEIIRDSVRQSNYVRYHKALDSLLDGLFRITDPTFRYVKEQARTLDEVFSIWTEDPGEYTDYVVTKLNQWIAEDQSMATAQIPGFEWVPADSEHYRKGRTQAIVGGAQHYSAGTNSKAWLSTTSGRNPYDPDRMVSAHLLFHNEPTLDRRGYQFVRFEDTAFTTGGIVNPKTVAIEKEHLAGAPISDATYEVMAHTWVDVARYVKNVPLLGSIDIIRGHRDWVGDGRVCPDGIDVPRINARFLELMGTPVTNPWQDPVTKHFIHELFQGFWSEHGGIADHGRPVSGAFNEDGRLVQYYERAVFQHFPENTGTPYEVQLRLLGTEELIRRYPTGTP